MNKLHTQLEGAKLSDALRLLRQQRPEATEALRQRQCAIDPTRHKVNDPHHRPDKRSLIDVDPGDTMMLQTGGAECYVCNDAYGQRKAVRIDRVNRITLALQRRIVSSAVAFTFGNPVLYNASPQDEAEGELYKAFTTALRSARIASHDRRTAKALYTYAEVAELWYASGEGKTSRLRCQILSPERGDVLIPYFDEYGDMTAFARSYELRGEAGKMTQVLDVYTAERLYRWQGEQMAEGYPRPNPLGKIPVVYAELPQHETAEVDGLIDRLETLLSNFSDTNDYHASPKIFVTGEVHGFSQRGEAGAIIEGDEKATAQYLSWASAPEAVRLEIDTLLRMIYGISQTPDVSFDSVKGLGAMSGTALKLLFMDAHLKVQERREVWDEYLGRRCALVLSMLAQMDARHQSALATLEIEPEITPYTITSDLEDLDYWLKAAGNKPLISHAEAIARAGLSHNAEATIEALRQEEAERLEAFSSEPATL